MNNIEGGFRRTHVLTIDRNIVRYGVTANFVLACKLLVKLQKIENGGCMIYHSA